MTSQAQGLIHLSNDDGWIALELHPAVGFVNKYVSVSRIETYENCPRRFFYRYVEKSETTSDTDTSRADVGTIVHAANDAVYRWVIAEEHEGVIPIEVIEHCFRRAYRESDRELGGADLYAESRALVFKYFERYPDADHWDVIASEQEFEIEITPGVMIKGFMDLVLRDGDGILIVDYKTNAMLYGKDELDHNLQASAYCAVARKLWPWAKTFRFRFEMLRHDLAQETERTELQLDEEIKYIEDTVARIERPFNEWPAKIGVLCGWCDHRSKCDAFKNAAKHNDVLSKANSQDDLAELNEERSRIASVAKALEQRKKEIESVFKTKMKKEELSDLTVGSVTYRVIDIKKTVYPAKTVIPLLARYSGESQEALEEKLSDPFLDKKKVEAFVAEIKEKHPEKRAMLGIELIAESEQILAFSRFEGRESKRSLEGGTKSAKTLPSAEYACSFCQASPAKRVNRGGAIFFVCDAHKNKRKAPKA